MPNPIKYSTSAQTLALKRGNFWIGTGDSDKGPSVSSGYYAGITPPEGGGYTIYLSNPGGDYNMFCPTNDTQLLSFTASELGQTFATGPSALAWFATQSDKMVTNIDYPNLVTNNLALNLDAGFISSYPRGGTSWYDLGPSGNNGALINGPTYSTSYLGSIVFDGVDDSVACGKNPSTLFSSMTISSWFSFNSYTDQTHIIIGRLGAGPGYNHNYFFGIQQKKFYFGFKNANDLNYPLVWIPDINPTIGVAYQFTATYSTTDSVKLYLNGSPRLFSGPNTSINPLITNQSVKQDLANSTCAIGSGYGQGNDFFSNANIYTAQLYSRVLSESEILLNYQSTFPRFLGQNIVTSGMIAYWNAGYATSYGGTGTTWTNVAGVSGGNGTLTNGPTYSTGNGGSIVFDGVDDYAAISNFMGNITTFTVSHFIYLSTTQNTRTIFSNYGIGNNGWVTGIRDDQNNIFKFYLGNTVHLYSNTVLSNLTWYHIAVTYNNGSPKIYINGVLDASSSNTITPASSYYGNDVGRLGVGSQYFNGRISSLQVYNRSLAASEILQNYQASLPQILTENIVTSGMIAYWDAGYATSYGGTGTTWYDVSGAVGGTGALTNGPTYATGNRGAIVFDGADDRVLYGSAAGTNYSNVHTFTTWVNINSTGGLGHVVIGHQAFNDGGYAIAFDYGPNRIYYSPSDGAFASATYTFSTNTWFNVTVVRNVRSLTWFINGSQIATGTTSTANLLCSSIGDYRNGGYPFNGRISLMRIYNRPLTQLEITQNYNAQKSRFGL